jgi:chromosome segregation and condensation protein ScpB
MHLELRARSNTQRHYEIYLVNATEGITADDIREMFERNPQTAADLIRERGHKYYSDRVNNNQVKII